VRGSRFPGRLLTLLFSSVLLPQTLHAACLPGDLANENRSITVVLLLPLNSDEYPLGDALLDGFVEGDIETVEAPCEVTLLTVNTLEEGAEFLDQWDRALEMEPDLLIGPLLREHQQQLAELEVLTLPPDSVSWFYPGNLDHLAAPDHPQWFTFSVARGSQIRTLLEYGWDQGQYELLLLLPDSDYGRSVADEIRELWETQGGVIRALAHYGERYSQLGPALRRVLAESRGEFDVLLLVADDERLKMVRPLMNYFDREEPVYTLSAPVGAVVGERDLGALFYPMQPALMEREEAIFDVDDLLRQVENVGFDLMLLLRQGAWKRLTEKGSYFGRAGRYTMEQNHLLRRQCMVTMVDGEQQLLFCPEPLLESALLNQEVPQ
jgi:outer membrane PBP1 activator LpoA protein